MNQPLTELIFAVFDFETTGIDPDYGHRACELAVERITWTPDSGTGRESITVRDTLDTLIDPQREISEPAREVNNLTRDMLVGKPKFHEIAPDVQNIFEGAVLVAHYAPFDLKFLTAESEIAGMSVESRPVADTCKLARRNFEFERYSLETIADSLDVVEPSHRSLTDVKATSGVLSHFLDDFWAREFRTLGDLLEAQNGSVPFPDNPEPSVAPEINHATEQRIPLQMRYRASSGDETTRQITPMRLAQNDDSSYLIAYCHARNEQRTFRLDRIIEWELIER